MISENKDYKYKVVVWHSGSALVSINEVNQVSGLVSTERVTMSEFNSRCRTFISGI